MFDLHLLLNFEFSLSILRFLVDSKSLDDKTVLLLDEATSSIKNSPTPLLSCINFTGNSAVLEVISFRVFDGFRVRPEPIRFSTIVLDSSLRVMVLVFTESVVLFAFFKLVLEAEFTRLFSFLI